MKDFRVREEWIRSPGECSVGISGGRRRNPAGSLENDLQSQTLSEYLFSLVKCRPWGTLGSERGVFGAPGPSFFGPYKISSPGDDIFSALPVWCRTSADPSRISRWARTPSNRPPRPNTPRIPVFFYKMANGGGVGLPGASKTICGAKLSQSTGFL